MAAKLTCDMVIPAPGMFVGRKIEIEGSTTHNISRFDINLEARGEDHGVIPLHISFRFQEGSIVRNTFNDRGWGVEERSGGMPLTRGKPFKVVLDCKSSAISISFGSLPFCQYSHRIPFHTITHLTVEREVSINSVRFLGTAPSPPPTPKNPNNNIREAAIPYELINLKIKLLGSIPAYSNRFDINLICKSTNEIALHISVRFAEHCIVRNTYTARGWGHEEKSGGMPLNKGTRLQAELLIKQNTITVAFNGRHFCEYTLRIPYNKITHVTLERDVVINSINFD